MPKDSPANLRKALSSAQKGSGMAWACIRSMGRALAATATLITAALLGPFATEVPAVRADPVDDKFIAALQSRDIHYRSPEAAIAAAHVVCAELDNGEPKSQVAQDVIDQTDLDPYHAGYFVGASVGAYCSQYASVN
jgi:hypothetical protein